MIFVKTYKTAGTSIEVFLSEHCGPDAIVTPIIPQVEPHRARNYSGVWNPLEELADPRARDLRGVVRGIVKNQKYYNHMPASLVKSRLGSDIWDEYLTFCVERNPWDKTLSHFHMIRGRGNATLTFDDYLSDGALCHNIGKYTDENGKVMVDRVLRYEDLNAELGRVFADVGIPFDGSLGVRAKSEHRADRSSYHESYTDEQRERVRTAFSDELSLHQYEY